MINKFLIEINAINNKNDNKKLQNHFFFYFYFSFVIVFPNHYQTALNFLYSSLEAFEAFKRNDFFKGVGISLKRTNSSKYLS